jgi:photosynthetic reaction center H subunit
VQAGDYAIVGRVSDMWLDEPEQLVRYLEVELDGAAGKRLIPLPLARIKSDRVVVRSIFGKHFPGVPTTKSRNQVTLLEEEKICAYYAGGNLYASEDRQA